jgi:3',5'-nucleoside bisphosphate phosphatase
MAGIDLHTHTIHSDGTFSPRELVELAAARGLDVVAVTDHDSVDGLDEATAAGARFGVEVVPGIELSTTLDGEGVHILCYFMDPEHPGLAAELRRLRESRYTRGERMVARLRELGYAITFERVQEIARGGNIVRPHVARALVEAGVIPTVKDAFTEELIGSGGRAYVEKEAIRPLEAIELVHAAKGVCVLAHPATYREVTPVPDGVIEDLAANGLDGIEASHPEHGPEMEAEYIELARRLGMLWTGSSDCHGTLYDPVRLGMRTTPPQQFEELRLRAKRRRG